MDHLPDRFGRHTFTTLQLLETLPDTSNKLNLPSNLVKRGVFRQLWPGRLFRSYKKAKHVIPLHPGPKKC